MLDIYDINSEKTIDTNFISKVTKEEFKENLLALMDIINNNN